MDTFWQRSLLMSVKCSVIPITQATAAGERKCARWVLLASPASNNGGSIAWKYQNTGALTLTIMRHQTAPVAIFV